MWILLSHDFDNQENKNTTNQLQIISHFLLMHSSLDHLVNYCWTEKHFQGNLRACLQR